MRYTQSQEPNKQRLQIGPKCRDHGRGGFYANASRCTPALTFSSTTTITTSACTTMEVNPGSSVAQKIPAEVWLEIFRLVPRSSDLHSLSVASRRFRDLTTRALHRDLVWVNEIHVAQNLPVWDENEGMENFVRSLQVGSGALEADTQGYTAVLEGFPHGNISQGPINMPGILSARIRSFVNLSSLTFTDMSIHSEHFALIHALPQLRSLRLDSCIFDHNAAQNVNNKNLPITELTLLNIRPSPRPRTHNPQNNLHTVYIHVGHNGIWPVPLQPLEPIAHAFSLAVARNLRTLTVDASADVFRLVFSVSDALERGWTVPRSMEHVYIVRDHTIAAWEPSQPANWGGALSLFPDTHLYHVCAHAPNLRTLSTPLFAPTHLAAAPELLPVSLDRFAAPLETAHFVATRRDVKALGLYKCGIRRLDGITALADIARARPRLKMLLMEVKTWDPEIVPAVSLHFRELRRLKVVYDSIGPDEVRQG